MPSARDQGERGKEGQKQGEEARAGAGRGHDVFHAADVECAAVEARTASRTAPWCSWVALGADDHPTEGSRRPGKEVEFGTGGTVEGAFFTSATTPTMVRQGGLLGPE